MVQIGDQYQSTVSGHNGKTVHVWTATVIALVPAGERPCDVLMGVEHPDCNIDINLQSRREVDSWLLIQNQPAGTRLNPMMIRKSEKELAKLDLVEEVAC